MHPYIEAYFIEVKQKEFFLAVRKLILKTGLYESFKCMKPCYTFKGVPVVYVYFSDSKCKLSFPHIQQVNNLPEKVGYDDNTVFLEIKSETELPENTESLYYLTLKSIEYIRGIS